MTREEALAVLLKCAKRGTHYTYATFDRRNGNYYVGVRTCSQKCPAEADITYLGSGKWVQQLKNNGEATHLEKHVLATYNSRSEADDEEIALIRSCSDDEKCMNRTCARKEAVALRDEATYNIKHLTHTIWSTAFSTFPTDRDKRMEFIHTERAMYGLSPIVDFGSENPHDQE